MARTLSKGEKPLDWVGSSKRDFLGFPEPVKDEMGNALGMAQFGGKHPSAKVAQQDYEARHGKPKH
jgi:phage-related protein